jgi:hypothetical protein
MNRVVFFNEFLNSRIFDLNTLILTWRIQELEKNHPNFYIFVLDKRESQPVTTFIPNQEKKASLLVDN